MVVEPADKGALVRLSTDYAIAGRVAQLGRSVMEDVSRRLTTQMADRIRARLEAPANGGAALPPAGAAGAVRATAEPVGGVRLLLAVLWQRLRSVVRRAR